MKHFAQEKIDELTTEPQFQRLYFSLREEISALDGIYLCLRGLSERLSPMVETESNITETGPVRAPALGIVSEFWEEVYRARQINENLRTIIYHLETVIGK